jgi:peptide/nickel transport system permease protein
VQSSLSRFLLVRVLTGAAVVVAVVAITWLTLFVLRPNVIDDGTPVLRQLTGYLGRVFLHFDLGNALQPGSPDVGGLILAGLPADLALLAGGLVVGAALGVGGGALVALRPRSLAARAAEAVAFVAFASPVYVVGLALLLLFGAEIAAVPVGVGIPLHYVEWGESPVRWFGALLVPWLVLGLPLAGLCFRVMSGLTIEALGAPYVQTARAKGLSHRAAVLRHAAPSGLLPTLSLAGAAMNTTLLNLALLEPVFGVPGVLRDLPEVIGTTDVDLLLGLTLVIAVLVVALNLAVDLLLRALDPALRLGGTPR